MEQPKRVLLFSSRDESYALNEARPIQCRAIHAINERRKGERPWSASVAGATWNFEKHWQKQIQVDFSHRPFEAWINSKNGQEMPPRLATLGARRVKCVLETVLMIENWWSKQ